MTMRHVCSWQYPSTLEKMMGTEETPHGVYFHCVQCEPLVNKVPLPQQSTILIRQAGHKRVTVKHCQDEEGQPLRISYFTEKSVRCARPTGYGWMSQHCRETLGDCPGCQLFLSFLTFYGSCLFILPAHVVNIISFLGLWGSWRLDIVFPIYQMQKASYNRK